MDVLHASPQVTILKRCKSLISARRREPLSSRPTLYLDGRGRAPYLPCTIDVPLPVLVLVRAADDEDMAPVHGLLNLGVGQVIPGVRRIRPHPVQVFEVDGARITVDSFQQLR